MYYEFSTTTATWDEAKLYCENDGGRLAVLDTEEKRVWMREFRLTQTGTTSAYAIFSSGVSQCTCIKNRFRGSGLLGSLKISHQEERRLNDIQNLKCED